MCMWVGTRGEGIVGCSPRGRNVQDRAGPDHVLLPSPSRSRTCSTSASPDTFFPTTLLSWNESRASARLPIIAVTSSQFCRLFSGHESAVNIMAYTCSPWRERKEKVFQGKPRASLNVKASLSENSHDKSIKEHAIWSLGSCLSKKVEWEYLKGQFRWEKEQRRKRHKYLYLKVWRTWQELWLQGRGGVFGMGDTRSEMQEEIEKLKDRADSKSSHPSRTWASG